MLSASIIETAYATTIRLIMGMIDMKAWILKKAYETYENMKAS